MASQNNRILIVDNNEEEASIFASMPECAGYHPRTTWSGLEAIEILKSEEFAILLVSNCLADPYVGDFLARLGSLSKQPARL
jgi:CheY-like chemotaxis protein